ncbi:MAG: hypothetical protein CVV44_02265 [Spirochaetae bacterium HGW-Spirochaetae-1]|jgi:hypothetical protein|nr:MAG: hypothetical protein CVV44_02265 [Spirochaetae bacterium HGW-Spirochaetae-1]
MESKNEIKQRLASLAEIFHSYRVSRVGLFGSYVHGSQNEESDIDLLVDFSNPIDLFSYVNLVDSLSAALGHKVDMVTVSGLKPALKKGILREVEWIEEL